jgi:hypothetical protein
MDHLPRLQFVEEERKERSKEQIGDLEEVTSPDVCCVIAQKVDHFWPRGWWVRTLSMMEALSYNMPKKRQHCSR